MIEYDQKHTKKMAPFSSLQQATGPETNMVYIDASNNQLTSLNVLGLMLLQGVGKENGGGLATFFSSVRVILS